MNIVDATLPIFVLIAIGFGAGRFGLVTREDFAALGKFVVTFALPALVFKSLAARPIAETFQPAYMAAYALASVGLLFGAWTFLRVARGTGGAEAAIRAMGMVCPNSGFVGYPIMLLSFPDIAGLVLALNMAVENLLVIPLALTLAEAGKHSGASALSALGKALSNVLRMPLVLGLIAGLAWSAVGLPVPGLLARPIDILAASSAALSLFVIGGLLAQAPLSSLDAAVAGVTFGKLVLHPLAAMASMALFSSTGFVIASHDMRVALLLTAALPIMGIYPILGMRYGSGQLAAFAVAATVALSFLTINGLFLLLPLLPF